MIKIPVKHTCGEVLVTYQPEHIVKPGTAPRAKDFRYPNGRTPRPTEPQAAFCKTCKKKVLLMKYIDEQITNRLSS